MMTRGMRRVLPAYLGLPGPTMDEREQTIEDREGRTFVPRSDRIWAFAAHLGGLATTVLAPIVVYVLKRDESEFVALQAREALNFQLTVLMVGFVCAAIVCAQPVLVSFVVALDFLFSLLGAARAHDGKPYRYPLSFRLIR